MPSGQIGGANNFSGGSSQAKIVVRKQELMNLLLLGIPMVACAARIGVTPETVRRYAHADGFLDELKELSASVYEDVMKDLRTEAVSLKDKIREESNKALDVLVKLMEDEAQKGIVRIKAADSILDRNEESARNRKVEGDFRQHHTIDPLMLLHAAATAQEIDSAKEAGKLPQTKPYQLDAAKEETSGQS